MAEKPTETPAPVATVTLPYSGQEAVVLRRLKGKDVRLASRAAQGQDQMAVGFALLAQVVRIDGRPVVMEDLDELDLADLGALMGAVPGLGEFSSSAPPTSLSS